MWERAEFEAASNQEGVTERKRKRSWRNIIKARGLEKETK